MFNNLYENKIGKNIINERISEYCKAEHLNEEYFRFSMGKLKSNSIVKNMIAAILFAINNIFKY